MHKVSVLFARADSVYFDLVFDVWDAQRDARRYAGPWPVVAHPPCRAWGRLAKLAKPRPDEPELAFYAVDFVRQYGGVIEHPYGSDLWPAAGLPKPGEVDEYGGWTVLVDQGWWGHHAPKPTWLYVVGMPRHHLDGLPVEAMRRKGRTLAMQPADRERTPRLFAEFLVRLAGRCYVRPGRTVTPVDRARLPSSSVNGYADLVAPETSAGRELLRRPGGVGYPSCAELLQTEVRVRESGGWGATPVQACGLEREGGGKSGDAGDFSRWAVPAGWSACCAPFWAFLAPGEAAVASAAQRRQGEAAAAGRAQRGLDLFLGQNRTQRGCGDATAP